MTAYRQLETENRQEFNNPLYSQYFQYYTLPYLLSTYGPPSQTYINFDVGIAEMGLGPDLYFLFLDYTEAGWVAELTMPLLWKDESKTIAVGCPSWAFTTMWLWAPDDAETAEEYGFADGTALKRIEDATSMTQEEFYQQYQDPATTKCFESPVDLYSK